MMIREPFALRSSTIAKDRPAVASPETALHRNLMAHFSSVPFSRLTQSRADRSVEAFSNQSCVRGGRRARTSCARYWLMCAFRRSFASEAFRVLRSRSSSHAAPQPTARPSVTCLRLTRRPRSPSPRIPSSRSSETSSQWNRGAEDLSRVPALARGVASGSCRSAGRRAPAQERAVAPARS